jgi:hypothetical protein
MKTNAFLHYMIFDIILVMLMLYANYIQNKEYFSQIVVHLLLQNTLKCLIVYILIKSVTTFYFISNYNYLDELVEEEFELSSDVEFSSENE